jgi:Fur family peroxide stress response transcriptional regulator
VIESLKYSRQRECIKSFLIGRKDHPTADTVYMHVRQEYPNISLGTVYRNLTLLSDIGEIARLNVGDGVDHFDADTSPHQHIICNTCGCVQDIFLPDTNKIIDFASNYYNGVITSHTLHFRGICSECAQKSGN